MAQNLFAKMKRDWTRLSDMSEDALNKYARHKIKPDLESIDNEYQIKFPFQVVKKLNDVTGSLEYSIEIPASATFIRKTDEQEVYVASLFTWLDKGISVSHVRLVTDPETGEKKAIASRRRFKYDNPYPPNNWTVDKAAYHQTQLPKMMLGVIRKFLRGKR